MNCSATLPDYLRWLVDTGGARFAADATTEPRCPACDAKVAEAVRDWGLRVRDDVIAALVHPEVSPSFDDGTIAAAQAVLRQREERTDAVLRGFGTALAESRREKELLLKGDGPMSCWEPWAVVLFMYVVGLLTGGAVAYLWR